MDDGLYRALHGVFGTGLVEGWCCKIACCLGAHRKHLLIVKSTESHAKYSFLYTTQIGT